tara:strand:- start:8276 stop:9628 length:1353 start_codon:yes stop_codon:yes gene_type:complete
MYFLKNNISQKEEISGWGNYPKIKVLKRKPKNIKELKNYIKEKSLIARGNGRSYGDSSINKYNTIDMKSFNKFLYFDNKNGLLIAEAGVLLSDIIKIFAPKGWFLNVTPGTKFVTLGGMVASDVHGKNHHIKGSFRNFIKWVEIINCEGKIIRCSLNKNKDLFNWTLGGMGLTGIILNVAFFLNSIETTFINQKILVSKNLYETISLFEDNIKTSYSVAWIDCYAKGKKIGRSIISLGEHSKKDELNITEKKYLLNIPNDIKLLLPIYFPSFLINNFTVKLFNKFYYYKNLFSKKHTRIRLNQYFYPLDKILNWNKFYGSKGFAQFQCVIPLSKAEEGLSELLRNISKSKSSSFLAVLKRFGKQNEGISFPMEGYSLALDFPINKRNLSLMDTLDKITIKYGGRFYLAKDSRIKKDIFDKSDERLYSFRSFRKTNLDLKFNSLQSNRLNL